MSKLYNPRPRVVLKDCRIVFPNFSGAKDQFNPNGDRSFNVALDPETGKDLMAEGWNVRFRPATDERDESYLLNIAVRFDRVPPMVKMITGKKVVDLVGDAVSVLDAVDFERVDVIFTPSVWEFAGKSGVKAYLKKGVFTVLVDELDDDYKHLDGWFGEEEKPSYQAPEVEAQLKEEGLK